MSFLHGLEIKELTEGAPAVETIRTAVIGLVGTAAKGKPNELYLISNPKEAEEAFGSIAAFRISRDEAKLAYDQAILEANAKAQEDANYKALKVALARAELDANAAVKKAVDKLSELTAARTPNASENQEYVELKKIADTKKEASETAAKAAADKLAELTNTDHVLLKNAAYVKASEAFETQQSFTLPRALAGIYAQSNPLVVAVNIKPSSGEAALSHYVGDEASETGIFAMLTAQAKVGVTPKILIVPTKSHETSLQEAFKKVTESLRAIAIIDSPEDGNPKSAMLAADLHSTSRFYQVHGWVEGTGDIGKMPLSPLVAGLIATNDDKNGYWSSPSNKVINGIKSVYNPVTWSLSDPNCMANRLNEKGVATVIQHGGFRLWGNRTLGKNSELEQAHVFVNVRRITDAINDTISRSIMWAMDRNITKNFIQDVLEYINNYLRNLRIDGAIIDGKAFVVPEENPPSQIKQGRVVFSFDYTPVFPAERITIKSIITDKYLAEVFEL